MAQFYSWFKFQFPLLLGIVIYDNEFETNEHKFKSRIKLNHNISSDGIMVRWKFWGGRTKVKLKTNTFLRRLNFLTLETSLAEKWGAISLLIT